MASEGLTDLVARGAVTEVAVLVDAAHHILSSILDGRQHLGKDARRSSVAADGRLELQGLVRTLQVVHLTPGIKAALHFHQIRKTPSIDQLGTKCAMKTLILSLGLRMSGPA